MFARFKYHLILALAMISVFAEFSALDGSRPALSPVAADDGIFLPIIMYHEIKTFKLGKDVITPYEFESDLIYLRDSGCHTITMTELIEFAKGTGELPENPVMLTFDDGYLSTYEYAFPLIQKYDVKIVLSVVGRGLDDFTEFPNDNIDYSCVTWDQLDEMARSGYVEVQNHTYNLHAINSIRVGCLQCSTETPEKYEELLTEDVRRLQDKIFEYTGEEPNTFTYPYGKYNEKSESIIKKLGFRATLTCDYGINEVSGPQSLFGLKRLSRPHGGGLKKILKEAQKTIKMS